MIKIKNTSIFIAFFALSIILSSFASAMTLGAGGGTLDANNSLLEVDEVINGQGALTVVDSANSMGTSLGKVLLTGNNTYSGGTVVDHATLAVNIDDNLGAASGGVTLNGGILQANMSDFSSARNIVLGADSGVLDPNGFNLTFSGNISGGTLGVGQTLSNGGSVTLSGTNNTYSGGTFIEGASLQAGGVNVLGNNGMVVMNRANNWDADLSLNGFDQTIGSLTGGVNSTVQLGHATLTTGGNDATSTFAGVISDSNDQQGGKIVKVGHGYFTLSGDNTYSGGTELDGGTVVISKDSNLGDSHGGITMGGGTLQLAGMVNSSRSLTLNSGGGTIDTDGNLSNFSGPVTGTGHLTVTDSYVGSSPLFMTYSFFPVNAGRGTLVLSGADNDYSGGTTVDGAVLRAGATNAFGTGGVNLISENISDPGSGSPIPMLVLSQGQNAVLDLSGYSQSIVSLTGDANSSVQLGGATLTVGSDGANTTFAGVISDCSDGALSCAAGSLVKVGPGTFSLTGNNSYAGGTTLSGGTLAVNSDQALGSTLANAALTFDGGALQNLASFNSSRNLLLNGAGTWDTNGFNSVASGNISGEGPLTKDGSGILTLSGTGNSYTGGTTVNGGTLQAGAQDVFGLGRVALANGSTLDLHNFNQTITSLSDDASGTQVTLGNAMLRVGTDNTNTTYSGIISGSGSLDKVGAGVLTLAGANTYQGGMTIIWAPFSAV
jgi:fibronectin-binding autotransporter adhesin